MGTTALIPLVAMTNLALFLLRYVQLANVQAAMSAFTGFSSVLGGSTDSEGSRLKRPGLTPLRPLG